MSDEEGGILILNNLNDAIVGTWNNRAVYDEERILDILAKELGSYEDAREWFDFNILNLVEGMDDGPIIMTPMDFDGLNSLLTDEEAQ